MRNADRIFVLAIATFALAACHDRQQDEQNNTISMDAGIPDNQIAGNADIETLPADESSTTPSSQLQNGADNPDVNSVSTSNSE